LSASASRTSTSGRRSSKRSETAPMGLSR